MDDFLSWGCVIENFIKSFPVWLQNRSISAGLEPVLALQAIMYRIIIKARGPIKTGENYIFSILLSAESIRKIIILA